MDASRELLVNALRSSGQIGAMDAFGNYTPSKPRATAKPYEQSWRDRLAAALIDRGLPAQTVDGLLGSRGLGASGRGTGMGLIDFTPAGAPLWLNEAHRARQSGDAVGNLTNTLAAVPVAGPAVKGAKAAAKGIRAYHGSPHDSNVGGMFDFSNPGGGSRVAKVGNTEVTYGVGKNGLVEVILVQTPRSARGQGSARAAMQRMIAEADAAGLRLGLNADPMDKGVTKSGLERFYKSLGFRRNAGRSRDFSTRAEYLRDPLAK